MVSLLNTGDDQRRQKSRNLLLAAFALLIIIWTVKLSVPQSSVLNIYSNHTPSPRPETPSPATAQPNSIILADPSLTAKNTTKAAVIIETRFRTNLIPLILHF